MDFMEKFEKLRENFKSRISFLSPKKTLKLVDEMGQILEEVGTDMQKYKDRIENMSKEIDELRTDLSKEQTRYREMLEIIAKEKKV